MNTTLALNDNWDLFADTSGNIATLDGPSQIAQDCASQIRLFQGELWYDTTQGIPYFGDVFITQPPIALVKALFIAEALTVPDTVSAVCYLGLDASRELTGQVQIKDSLGNFLVANSA